MNPLTKTLDPWVQQAADTIRAAQAQGSALAIEGHGSKRFYGLPIEDAQTLSTLGYSGVVDYDPTELVVVVKSGTPIQELEGLLAQSRQMLAFEPPRFSGKGTVGGMVAAGLSGPRRRSAGAMKDFILGMTLLDAQASPLRFGGTVMKNVAGYDLPRLHTGALGTLGLMVDLSIKVLPSPVAEASLCFEVDAQQAIHRLNAWASQPLPISASSWHDGLLHLRLSGAKAAVSHALTSLGGVRLDDDAANRFWQQLRDHEHSFFSPDPKQPDEHLWRLSLPPATPHLDGLQGPQWIEWGGALRWLKSSAAPQLIWDAARHAGGHATLFRTTHAETRRALGVFAALTPAVMRITHRLKKELDPQGIFNPGRMYAGF